MMKNRRPMTPHNTTQYLIKCHDIYSGFNFNCKKLYGTMLGNVSIEDINKFENTVLKAIEGSSVEIA